MASLADFFDSPLQKKISAIEIPIPQLPIPEIPAPNFSDALPPVAQSPPTTAFPHPHNCGDSKWLDAYGTWRCEICFPPIFESEVCERKKINNHGDQENQNPATVPAAGGVVGEGGTGEVPDEKNSSDEFFNVHFQPEYFFESQDLVFQLPQESPCTDCGSLAFWWDLLDARHCQRCRPRPNRSRELLELVPNLQRLAKFDPTWLAKQAAAAKE